MTIYIESFLIENMMINYSLLRLVHITTKSKTTMFRMIISSLLGAISSFISVYFITSSLALNIIKVLTASLMLIIAFNEKFKQLIFNFILLFVYTYSLAGAITSFNASSYITSFGIVTSSKISLFAVSIIVIVLSYIFELVAKHVRFRMQTNNLIFPITLIDHGKQIKINAYLDTGNLLNYDGKPIVIVDLETILKLKKINLIDFYLSSSAEIGTKTVCGNENLKVFNIENMQIKIGKELKNFENQLVAVNVTNSFKNANYKALLSPLML